MRVAFFGILLLLASCQAASKPLKVQMFNIWHEGTQVPGGYEAVVEEIARVDAQLVALSEVRNYNDQDFTQKLIASLKEKGLTYYSGRADDTGLLSKYPILEFSALYPVTNDHGSITKAVVEMPNGQQIAFYSAHLDYQSSSYWRVKELAAKADEVVLDTLEIRRVNLASERDDATAVFLKDADAERQKGRWVFIGGDFNEPSHFDWIEATKNRFNHNGLVFNWNVSRMLENAGYVDCYRREFPNPVTHPGITFPSANPAVDLEKITWIPSVDRRERLDAIYFYPDAGIKLKKTYIQGPKAAMNGSKAEVLDNKEPYLEPLKTWPSDHRAVVAEFEVE